MDPMKHNYMKKLIEMYRRGLIPVVAVMLVDIYHDNWCGIYKNRHCNCDPDIVLPPLPIEPRSHGRGPRAG
jgi:hypothetical protein